MIFPKIWIICRVCLKQEDDMFNLFDDTIHKNIWTSLRDCSGLPVRKNDSLPDKICEECLTRLWKAMNFRIDCQRSHRELLQKQIENNVDLFTEGSSAELLKLSKKPNLEIATGEQEIFTYVKKDKENTLTETSNGKSNVDDVKQYCVISRNTKRETSPGPDKESQSKQPIVLLLRLKNISNESSQKERRALEKLETETNITPTSTIKTRRKTLTETLNKEVNNDNNQLWGKTVNAECKAPAEKEKKLSTNKTNFHCNICKKVCKTNELLRHHSYIHKRPYECKICHKKFSQGHSFLSHNNYHTGIKPYYCRICFETFSDISNRNCHERLRHKERQFNCTTCNKSFRFLTLLQKHSNSHKPKKCFICNKDFASVRMVRLHHKRKHLKMLHL